MWVYVDHQPVPITATRAFRFWSKGFLQARALRTMETRITETPSNA
jgi:hypothetical protein